MFTFQLWNSINFEIAFHALKSGGKWQVAVEQVKVLNSVKVKLPFLVTTGDDVKDSAKEEIRLR